MSKLTKTGLIQQSYEALQAKSDGEKHLTKGEVERVLNQAIELMQNEIINGGKVLISSFVSMYTKTYKGRKYSNPSTQKALTVPARIRPRARFSDVFVDQVTKANPVNKTSSRSKKAS